MEDCPICLEQKELITVPCDNKVCQECWNKACTFITEPNRCPVCYQYYFWSK